MNKEETVQGTKSYEINDEKRDAKEMSLIIPCFQR